MVKKKFRPVPKEMLGQQQNQLEAAVRAIGLSNDENSSGQYRSDRSYNDNSRRRNNGGHFNQSSRDGGEPGEESSASSNPWRSSANDSSLSSERPSHWRNDDGQKFQNSSRPQRDFSSRNQRSGPREGPDDDGNSSWRNREAGQGSQYGRGSSTQYGESGASSRSNWAPRERSSNENGSRWRADTTSSERVTPSTEDNKWRNESANRQSMLPSRNNRTNEEFNVSQSFQTKNREEEVQMNNEQEIQDTNVSLVEHIEPSKFSWCDSTYDESQDSTIDKSVTSTVDESEQDTSEGKYLTPAQKKRSQGYSNEKGRDSESSDRSYRGRHSNSYDKSSQGRHSDSYDRSSQGRHSDSYDRSSRGRPSFENREKGGGYKSYSNSINSYPSSKEVTNNDKVREEDQDLSAPTINESEPDSSDGKYRTPAQKKRFQGYRNEKGRDSESSDKPSHGRHSDSFDRSSHERRSDSFKGSSHGRHSFENRERGKSSFSSIFQGSQSEEQDSFISYLSSKEATNYDKVKEEDQDLFEVGEEYALAHCVAEDLNMGSGIAVEFRSRFKKVSELMDQQAETGGLAFLTLKSRFIYYLVTKKKSQGKPTYYSLWSSLLRLRTHMKENKVTKLAMPRIGCGLDRLNWDYVKPMLEFLFKDEDVEILVCNYQPEGQMSKMVKKCKVVFESKPITQIDPETIIIYFASQDGKITEEMKILDEKFKFLTQFATAPKAVGDNVRQVPPFNKNYILYGCIVKENFSDPFGYSSFNSCLHKICKNYKTDNYFYIAFQSLEDDLLNTKILNLMKHTLKDIDIYICGCSEGPSEE